MDIKEIHESTDDFNRVFPGYGFLFLRNLQGRNEIQNTYIDIVKLFNNGAHTLIQGDNATTAHICATLVRTYPLFRDIDISHIEENLANVWIEIAKTILVSSTVECPGLISMVDDDGIDPPDIYRAEYHLETRQQTHLSGSYTQFPLNNTYLKEIPIDPKYIFEKWNIQHFSKKPDTIPTIGLADETLSAPCPTRVFNIPIRIPGDAYIRIPEEFTHLNSLIQKLSDHAFSVTELYKKTHPDFVDRFYYYLSVDQRMVNAGEKHRGPNPHSDDLQGPRYVLGKLPAGWEYIVADTEPTTIYKQSFNLSGLNEHTDDLWIAIEEQADEQNTYQLKPYEIGMMSFYDIHRGSYMKQTGIRTFIKMVVSEKIFDNLGDTINPAFIGEQIGAITYPWRFTSRKVQKFVNLDRYKT